MTTIFHHGSDSRHGLHIGESLKKAAKWYLIHSAELYIYPPMPTDNKQK